MISRIRFFCDAMLGRLARELRFCGYSAEYRRDIADREMVEHCLKNDLVLLTRDREVLRRKQIARGELTALAVESDFPTEQLRQVLTRFQLDAALEPLCSVCNQPLDTITREAACKQVPEYVCVTQARFKRCPVCGRIYWKATHWPGIEGIRRTGDKNSG